ncbi:MAG: beta-glucosidase BglX [Candidatus Methylacidiphilales bacterium]
MRKTTFTVIAILIYCTCAFANNNPANATEGKMNGFINDLLGRMTLEEKIGQLNLLMPSGSVPTGSVVNYDVESSIRRGNVGAVFGVIGVEKVKRVQELAVNESRLKIPLMFGSDIIHGYKTTFPIPLALASSWNLEMIERSARVAATEATADGLCWNFSPMVDISRDPRWGRVAEGAGEDPYLGSRIASVMVRGYQGDRLEANNTMMACVKHFALYGTSEGGRDYNTTDMSRIMMYEYFLPPYKAAIDAGAGSIMCSFNEIDAIPATANKWLLTDLLRNQWGFKGFVVSDATAVQELVVHGIGDLQSVSAKALKAGVNMDMVSEAFVGTLKKSVEEGKVSVEEIDRACRGILEAKYKLGLFEDPYRYIDAARADKEVLSESKKSDARYFATRSMVLLKNDKQTLPLRKAGTIALVGPLANNKADMLGNWAVNSNPNLAVSILEGIRNAVPQDVHILYSKGANISDDPIFNKNVNYLVGKWIEVDPIPPETLLSQAREAAEKADVVVAVVGEAAEMSGESASRSDISLPESQRKLLQELAKTGKPLVVVLMSGRPLAIPKEADLATSLIMAWFPGQEAGNAVADVLFGDYNPSGKLTMSFPRAVGQIPIYYNHKNTGRPQVSGVTMKFLSNYLDVSNDPLFPFGYGLSYTTFSYSDVTLSDSSLKPGQTITATVNVTNIGKYDGTETVQLYIRDIVGSVTRPVKELKGFQQIALKSGETRNVTFTISPDDLRFYNAELQYVTEPGDFKLFIGTNSSDVKEASFRLLP